jgi:23S rRNA (guanosine2251-2'-O)-methyltransferase
MKTSAGALNHMPVCRIDNLEATITYLRNHGLKIVAATEKTDKTLFQHDLLGPIALVVGSEENGISEEILDMTDLQISIPMRGKIDSLNVSVSTGIILYEIIRQRLFIDSDLL